MARESPSASPFGATAAPAAAPLRTPFSRLDYGPHANPSLQRLWAAARHAARPVGGRVFDRLCTGFARGSLEGRVPALTGRQTLWLEVRDRRVLVYGTRAERAAVFPSVWVRAAGTIRDDCIQMADIALPARHIEVLGQHIARAPALPLRRAEQTSPRGCRMPQNCRPSMRIP
jgi:hypothetical protein